MLNKRIAVRWSSVVFTAMAGLVLISSTHASTTDVAIWCVAIAGLPDSAYQRDLDYACSAGADCSSLQAGGACYTPNTLYAHTSYAINSYFQSKAQNPSFCNFNGTAQLTTTDPSTPGCAYLY